MLCKNNISFHDVIQEEPVDKTKHWGDLEEEEEDEEDDEEEEEPMEEEEIEDGFKSVETDVTRYILV